MKTTARQDKALLLATGKAVAQELKQRSDGTTMKIRLPSAVGATETGGWRIALGRMGRRQLWLEIWFDKFSGSDQRKFYLGINTREHRALKRLANGVARKLRPHRVITDADLNKRGFVALAERLRRDEYGVPLFEKYRNGWSFYGLYDATVRSRGSAINPHFCARAAAFFESVARTLPRAKPEDEEREVYPQFENRKVVASHLQRERSRLLATECKIRDDYECQVCGLRFEDFYGVLGRGFAEAHHIVPLNKLRGAVKTRLEDLLTVCANCHRMLHRMDGKPSDVVKLRRLVPRRRR